MFTKALLSTTAFAAAASAFVPNLQARQTGTTGFSEECQSAMNDVMPLYSSMPTPPPAVMSAITASPAADPCATPDLSGSALSQWESYTSEINDWASSNSAALQSALQECTEFTQYASVPVCTGSAAQPTGSSSDDSTGTSSGDASGATGADGPSGTEGGNATETPGAASRQTGMMAAAAVVAAAVLGFVL
ncbi:hypothetical protein DL766_001794 [Monosporascus sp. MC13-8B]|uniref:Infection structure specific protein n=1 Tax=Monosporascus cannonballus TaxID=155416 RepID=A0ABY0HKG3_9PEZI|nr:hypothetical protein DL763_008591 [Monosporascus cannonballus]RYO92664.1 hypothetical protein DL762_001567 [Monosporascus cannonballus]RYP36758.1 hypothetical protein DL766_001794 [Monosporascus sp. MC13-8B]